MSEGTPRRSTLTRRLLRNVESDGTSEREALHEIALRLIQIATRLSAERGIDDLLPRIVTEARQLTHADGGSLYVVDGNEMVFSVLQNRTLEAAGRLPQLKDLRFPLDGSSLAGLAAMRRRSLNIPDVRRTRHHRPDVDARNEYTTRSMLVVPMINPKHEVIGVLQLINAQTAEGGVESFHDGLVPYVEALAALAAVSLENMRLYDQMNTLFESLVRYSVRAIDARDPCTAGHSSRVAAYATKLAREVGGFDELGLREIRLAGLLHDVGKIGVREHILTKSLKLPAERFAAVAERFEAAIRAKQLAAIRESGSGASGLAHNEIARALHADLDFLASLQLPRPLSDEDLARIQRLRQTTFVDSRGRTRQVLEDAEAEAMLVTRGNLTRDERKHMEGHALHTHKLLEQLPFPKHLANVASYAALHHEKLNGSGYPFGLAAPEIPLGSRIMAIADIYDSLMAEDRPYKPPMSEEKAMGILGDMVKSGELDPDVFAALERLVARNAIGPRRGSARQADKHWAETGYTETFESTGGCGESTQGQP